VYLILDEFVLGGEIEESSKKVWKRGAVAAKQCFIIRHMQRGYRKHVCISEQSTAAKVPRFQQLHLRQQQQQQGESEQDSTRAMNQCHGSQVSHSIGRSLVLHKYLPIVADGLGRPPQKGPNGNLVIWFDLSGHCKMPLA
jgi:hypothetical protein